MHYSFKPKAVHHADVLRDYFMNQLWIRSWPKRNEALHNAFWFSAMTWWLLIIAHVTVELQICHAGSEFSHSMKLIQIAVLVKMEGKQCKDIVYMDSFLFSFPSRGTSPREVWMCFPDCNYGSLNLVLHRLPHADALLIPRPKGLTDVTRSVLISQHGWLMVPVLSMSDDHCFFRGSMVFLFCFVFVQEWPAFGFYMVRKCQCNVNPRRDFMSHPYTVWYMIDLRA